MIKHVSIRLAWHNEGWNGHICTNPKSNVYCVGQFSYPGDMIAEKRDLEWESAENIAGFHCSKIDRIPPCAYSINAFGTETIKAESNPPVFYRDESEGIIFDLPPATACIWPYEVMYSKDVLMPKGSKQIYDYEKRLKNAKLFFGELTGGKSLIFYYVNKSNPFSEDDSLKYVIVGVSRLKKVGEIMYLKNVSEENRKKYAGGFVWQLPISSCYPDEGFRIPYQKYFNNEEILNKLILIPEYSENFKYAARYICDDDALIYVERLLEIVYYLIEIKDDTEDWQVRKSWLLSLLSELWKNRGHFPGLPSVLDYLEYKELIPFYKKEVELDRAKEAKENIFKFLNDRSKTQIPYAKIDIQTLNTYRRTWFTKVQSADHRSLLSDTLTRIDLRTNQVKKILSDKREQNGIYSSLKQVIENPFILSEQYVGDEIGDEISFNKIDHAVLPSPELGLETLIGKDEWKRLRALCIENLKSESKHSFVAAESVINDVNYKLSFYPDWKKEEFNLNYLDFDKENISESIQMREKDSKIYLYIKQVYEDERLIEKQIRELVKRPDITLTKPFSEEKWKNELYIPDNVLATKASEEYEKAIKGQIEVCNKIFTKPVCVISGAAGTGKTTIIKAIINAIKFTSNNRESFCLLAPTGKAADKIREKTNEDAFTIHQLIARKGWLNPNYSFKRTGGNKEDGYSTYLIDESSMLDLSLIATLFRTINWNFVKRMIFVGDPNQLPPIGKGKIFSDIIQFLNNINPEAIGKLEINVRQMENRVLDKGTGILELASMYIQENLKSNNANQLKAEVENFLKDIQLEGDVRPDLRIISWENTAELENKVLETLKKDMEEDKAGNTEKHQIISPYRGELFGTEHINSYIQQNLNNYNITNKGNLGGITLFDKVIQFVNRAGSNCYWAYNIKNSESEKIDVYNGEIGFVKPHSFDKNWKWNQFIIRRFQVVFTRKPEFFVDFQSESEVNENIELAYAISVHKSQGSEFDRVYFILPKNKQILLSTELLYTGITRAKRHLTIFVEKDFTTFITLRRPEKSHLAFINSSVFEFNPLKDEMLKIREWYEEGKINITLANLMVRSKSEVIIANMLFEKGIDFKYEEPLFATDKTFYLPDFTIYWQGKIYYWEHVGRLDQESYKNHWELKKRWYDKHFPDQLLTTFESGKLSKDASEIISKYLS